MHGEGVGHGHLGHGHSGVQPKHPLVVLCQVVPASGAALRRIRAATAQGAVGVAYTNSNFPADAIARDL